MAIENKAIVCKHITDSNWSGVGLISQGEIQADWADQLGDDIVFVYFEQDGGLVMFLPRALGFNGNQFGVVIDIIVPEVGNYRCIESNIMFNN